MKVNVFGPNAEKFSLVIDSVVSPGDVVIVQTILLVTDIKAGEAMAVLSGITTQGIRTSMLFPEQQEQVA